MATRRKPYVYPATVMKVKDGDTVKFNVDLGQRMRGRDRDFGFSMYVEEGLLRFHVTVRLFGLNAPERSTAAGKAAKAHLAGLLPVGSAVTLRTIKTKEGDKLEKYGRLLATVFTGEQDVCRRMIDDGHAFAWDGTGAKPVS